ncbi:tRNA (adenosine(37)-N6)-dimethylallyltransferase MiaA [bacterium]|nr:tRNA (adenosine(37)-N6)-dimethylallyltransferase MiaA [bacterium]
MKRTALVITGPTASGKSALAEALCEKFNAQLINADAVQIYQGFDIGSAKPDAKTRERYKLLSVLSPDEQISAGKFRELCLAELEATWQRKKLPIVVGGSGLYLRALLSPFFNEAEIGENQLNTAEKTVLEIEERFAIDCPTRHEFSEKMHEFLAAKDPVRAASLDPHDLKRIRRSLILSFAAKTSFNEVANTTNTKADLNALVVALLPDREALYQRIESRVDQMLESGLINEVQGLIDRWGRKIKPLEAIGYKEVLQYLDEKISKDEMLELIKKHSRNFAKRQLTWWRHQPQTLGWEIVTENLQLVNLNSKVDFEKFLLRELEIISAADRRAGENILRYQGVSAFGEELF